MPRKFRLAIIYLGSDLWTAGGEYCRNLVLALGTLPPQEKTSTEVFLVCTREQGDQHAIQLQEMKKLNPDLEILFYEPSKRKGFIDRLSIYLKRQHARVRNVALHELLIRRGIDFAYPLFDRHHTNRPYKSAVFLPDYQHVHLPHFFSEPDFRSRQAYFSEVTTSARAIVVSSKNAAKDVREFHPHCNANLHILPFRSNPSPSWFELDPSISARTFNLPSRYFMICNQFWKHKNHLLVLDALRILSEKNIRPHVVMSGNIFDYRQPNYFNEFLQALHKSNLSPQVHVLGILEKKTQIQLMRQSIAILQPSLFEGWSTVVEEARLLGKPLILSDLEVLAEQVPNNQFTFRRDSSPDLATVMQKCLESNPAGFDQENELAARHQNEEKVREFALRFLAIARS